jgi:hypothetical protein
MIDRLKTFELTWGWIIRWVLMLALGYLLLFADTRYLKRDEVEQYMEKFHALREDDMSQIYSRIERVRSEAQSSDLIVRKLEGKLERIAAQNEMIIKRLDALPQ